MIVYMLYPHLVGVKPLHLMRASAGPHVPQLSDTHKAHGTTGKHNSHLIG